MSVFADLPFALHLLPVTPFAQNCSVLVEPERRRAVIIDPGGDAAAIIRLLAELGARPRALWLTHGHFDHVGAAAALKRTFPQIEVLGPHADDAWLVEHVEEQGELFGVPAGESVTPERWLKHGDVLHLGRHAFKVRHCPGHTPGHVVFLNEERRIGFVGDVLFKGSIGRTDLPGGDHERLLASIRENLLSLPDDVRIVPGHGPVTTIGAQRRDNPFLRTGA